MIRSTALFSDLTPEDLNGRLLPIDNFEYHPQTTIYGAGVHGHHVFTVRSGFVKLIQVLPGGTQRIVRLLRQGDVAGLEALLGEPYRHTVVTVGKVDLCRIPVEVLHELDRDRPRLYNQLLRRWQRSVDEADKVITLFSTGNASARLARLLLSLPTYRQDGACIALSREEIGQLIGVSTETASRLMADLKRQSVIHESGGMIDQCDRERLERLALD